MTRKPTYTPIDLPMDHKQLLLTLFLASFMATYYMQQDGYGYLAVSIFMWCTLIYFFASLHAIEYGDSQWHKGFDEAQEIYRRAK